MEWEIIPFESVGPIRFGMTPEQVMALIGEPEDIDEEENARVEFRELDEPIIRYRNGKVTEIEAFYDVDALRLQQIFLFREPGQDIMRRLTELNGGAEETVGIVLFRNLGITTGRLDEGGKGENSVTAFAEGLWDHDTDFKPIAI